MDIKDFQKKPKGRKHVVTSVNLEEKHREFLKRKNIEVSAFIRAIVDELIEKEKKGP